MRTAASIGKDRVDLGGATRIVFRNTRTGDGSSSTRYAGASAEGNAR
jgi:hypothetical protein